MRINKHLDKGQGEPLMLYKQQQKISRVKKKMQILHCAIGKLNKQRNFQHEVPSAFPQVLKALFSAEGHNLCQQSLHHTEL